MFIRLQATNFDASKLDLVHKNIILWVFASKWVPYVDSLQKSYSNLDPFTESLIRLIEQEFEEGKIQKAQYSRYTG